MYESDGMAWSGSSVPGKKNMWLPPHAAPVQIGPSAPAVGHVQCRAHARPGGAQRYHSRLHDPSVRLFWRPQCARRLASPTPQGKALAWDSTRLVLHTGRSGWAAHCQEQQFSVPVVVCLLPLPRIFMSICPLIALCDIAEGSPHPLSNSSEKISAEAGYQKVVASGQYLRNPDVQLPKVLDSKFLIGPVTAIPISQVQGQYGKDSFLPSSSSPGFNEHMMA